MKKRTVSPTHPGEMLREDFMTDFGLNVTTLATALGVSRQTANELVQCRRTVTPVREEEREFYLHMAVKE